MAGKARGSVRAVHRTIASQRLEALDKRSGTARRLECLLGGQDDPGDLDQLAVLVVRERLEPVEGTVLVRLVDRLFDEARQVAEVDRPSERAEGENASASRFADDLDHTPVLLDDRRRGRQPRPRRAGLRGVQRLRDPDLLGWLDGGLGGSDRHVHAALGGTGPDREAASLRHGVPHVADRFSQGDPDPVEFGDPREQIDL